MRRKLFLETTMFDGWKWIAISMAVFVVVVILGREKHQTVYRDKTLDERKTFSERLNALFVPLAIVLGVLLFWLLSKWKR